MNCANDLSKDTQNSLKGVKVFVHSAFVFVHVPGFFRDYSEDECRRPDELFEKKGLQCTLPIPSPLPLSFK